MLIKPDTSCPVSFHIRSSSCDIYLNIPKTETNPIKPNALHTISLSYDWFSRIEYIYIHFQCNALILPVSLTHLSIYRLVCARCTLIIQIVFFFFCMGTFRHESWLRIGWWREIFLFRNCVLSGVLFCSTHLKWIIFSLCDADSALATRMWSMESNGVIPVYPWGRFCHYHGVGSIYLN